MTQPNRVRAQKKLSAIEGEKDLDSSTESQAKSQPESQTQLQLPTPPSSSTPTPSSSPSPSTQTRKQKRRALLAESLALSLHNSSFPNPAPESDVPSRTTILISPHHLTPPTPNLPPTMSTPTRLLICSIGNPAPYTNTLHSAGHTILSLLAPSLSNPSFQKSRSYGNGLLSSGSTYTLWKSSSLMNISGVGVTSAWTSFQRESSSAECKLVVIHDELELPAGRINVKPGSNSPKGHNGLKSIRDTLRGQPYTRIGIGIGRPESRDAGVVANYVLRKMSAEEKRKIEGCVGKVLEELARLSGE
ncbi:putative peptidyl-trna hydrolase 2 protein [Botrytis fragariae]|uniref:peptidyl-tRNA hydrolase n=1 Tax=Botrytis fragariae TaxID=1964551 RepID=A0A8H6AU86_9HELO|nr:putative peptidyl-trna hydrolase 2 protein [Botrytis fragariae]KAF5873744.1 putative peptidyl-trna hydrolase 2 protein [Botrytis fragariae]